MEVNQSVIGSDELQPCIEDIRLEIDRLRREEQLLRERFVFVSRTSSQLSRWIILVVQRNQIVLVLVLFQVHLKKFMIFLNNEKLNQFILYQRIQ